MQRKSFKEFENQLSWPTKFYVLSAVSLLVFAIATNVGEASWGPAILLTLLTTLLVNASTIYFRHHPRAWNIFWWVVVLLLLSFFLIGFKS